MLGAALLIGIRTAVNYSFWGELVSGPHAHFAGRSDWGALLGETARRTFGLLVDQEFGLLTYAPVYVLALWGAVSFLKTRRDVALSIFLTAGCYLALVICPLTNVHGWTGGWNPAARFLTPIVPLLGLCVYAGLAVTPRPIAIAIVTLQIAINCYAWQHPKILWNDGDGRAALCEQLGEPVCSYLPTFVRQD